MRGSTVDLAGMAPGRYTRPIGGDVELAPDGRLSMVGTDVLAGLAVDLAAVVAWVLAHTPLALAEVVAMATAVPAAVVAACGGWTPAPGLRVGARADLLVLADDGPVREVHRAGRRL